MVFQKYVSLSFLLSLGTVIGFCSLGYILFDYLIIMPFLGYYSTGIPPGHGICS